MESIILFTITFLLTFLYVYSKAILEVPKITLDTTQEMIIAVQNNNMIDFKKMFLLRDYMKREIALEIVKYNRADMLDFYLTGMDNIASFVCMDDLKNLPNDIKAVLIKDKDFANYINKNDNEAYLNFKTIDMRKKISGF
jgi:hypothetical protein